MLPIVILTHEYLEEMVDVGRLEHGVAPRSLEGIECFNDIVPEMLHQQLQPKFDTSVLLNIIRVRITNEYMASISSAAEMAIL
jgi:hypothetical protein